MTLTELEEELNDALCDILPAGFTIEVGKNNKIRILTGLSLNPKDQDGALYGFEDDDEEPSFDGDFDSLEEEEEDDEEE